MSNLGGGGGGGGIGLGLGLGGGIPTIDTGKQRRMAGRPSTAAGGKSNNMDEQTPTLSKYPSKNDDGGSTYNRLGSGGADRGSSSKPGNSGLFAADRSSISPPRDAAGLGDFGFGRPPTGNIIGRPSIPTLSQGGGLFGDGGSSQGRTKNDISVDHS
jgi:hypothetical protein